MRSEYTANLKLSNKTEIDYQVEKQAEIKARIAKIRAEKAKAQGKRNWWQV